MRRTASALGAAQFPMALSELEADPIGGATIEPITGDHHLVRPVDCELGVVALHEAVAGRAHDA